MLKCYAGVGVFSMCDDRRLVLLHAAITNYAFRFVIVDGGEPFLCGILMLMEDSYSLLYVFLEHEYMIKILSVSLEGYRKLIKL